MRSEDKDHCADFPNEETLLKALVREVKAAQECIYKRVFYKWIPILMGQQLDYDSANDIIQEGMISFFKNLNIFRQESTLNTYLHRIINNKYIDYERKRGRIDIIKVDDLPEPPRYSPEDELHSPEVEEELRRAISKLTPQSQQIITLSFFEGLSNPEIAKKLGITTASVSTQKYRALGYLMNILKDKI